MELNEDTEIEIITDDDETLKTLGELLSNKTSRDLLKYLMNKEAYKMKISNELKIPFSLIEHHLKKMEKLGLVKITNKQIVKGGVLHKTYKITATGIFILLNSTKEEIIEKGILKKIFKETVKFASIGSLVVLSWFSTKRIPNSRNDGFDYGEILEIPFYEEPVFFPMLIIILAFTINSIFNWKKRRKSH